MFAIYVEYETVSYDGEKEHGSTYVVEASRERCLSVIYGELDSGVDEDYYDYHVCYESGAPCIDHLDGMVFVYSEMYGISEESARALFEQHARAIESA